MFNTDEGYTIVVILKLNLSLNATPSWSLQRYFSASSVSWKASVLENRGIFSVTVKQPVFGIVNYRGTSLDSRSQVKLWKFLFHDSNCEIRDGGDEKKSPNVWSEALHSSYYFDWSKKVYLVKTAHDSNLCSVTIWEKIAQKVFNINLIVKLPD